MKITVITTAILVMLLSLSKGEDRLSLLSGGSSGSHLYLPNNSEAASQLEHDVVAGIFLEEYIKHHSQTALRGKVTANVRLPEYEKNHQEDEIYLLSYTISIRGVEEQTAKAYYEAVSTYLDLRTKGFTTQYAIELILQPRNENTFNEDVKSIVLQHPDANPFRLVLTYTKQHKDWIHKIYKIEDGDFEWSYEMEIPNTGKIFVSKSRKKRIARE